MSAVTLSLFTISTSGNWCSGYYWQITNRKTGRVYHESGPYHYSNGREIAFDDAVSYADNHDLPLDTTMNPHRGE